MADECKKLYELAQKEPREASYHWNLRIKIATNQPRIVLKKMCIIFITLYVTFCCI